MNGTAYPTTFGEILYYLDSLWDQARQESEAILDHILIALVVYLLVCIVLYKITKPSRFPDHLKRILIVTAHPDDECMFFSPTILSLSRRKDCQVHLLCLSNGNYEKKAYLRRSELWSSCEVLQLRPEHVTLCNVSELQDDPTVEWKAQTVARIIRKYVESMGIQAIITFDQDGVSGHSNHCHIYYAVASLFLNKSLRESDCRLFTLDTVNVIRKYLLVFDLPITLLLSTNRFILDWKDLKVAQNAMRQHRSQLLWFRYLYIYFSRYMLINSLRQIRISDIELDLQLL